MKGPKTRRLIQLHQLSAIARTVLLPDPTISDAEWKARTKEKLAKQGYASPHPELLEAALKRVEKSLEETMGPRPVDLPVPVRTERAPESLQADPPWTRFIRPSNGWRSLRELIATLQGFVSSAPSSEPSPGGPRREPFNLEEHEVLNEFWGEVSVAGADRIAILRLFAELAIVRPDDWDYAEVRAQSAEHTLLLEQCFACRSGDRLVHAHHVVQVQHGGSNTSRNRVALCNLCHAAIHPWMPEQPPDRDGMESLGNIAEQLEVESMKAAR